MKKESKMVTLRKNGLSKNRSSLEDYVVSGAVACCSCGTRDVRMVFPDRGYIVGDAPAGLDADVSVSGNFSGNFGICRFTKEECSPVFASRWVETGKRQTVAGGHPLLARSILACQRGGAVTIRSNGQNL